MYGYHQALMFRRPAMLGASLEEQLLSTAEVTDRTRQQLIEQTAEGIILAGNTLADTLNSAYIDSLTKLTSQNFKDLMIALALPVGGAVLEGSDDYKLYQKINSIRGLGMAWINEVQKSWFQSGLQDELAAKNPSLAKTTDGTFNAVVVNTNRLVDIMGAVLALPDVQLYQWLSDYWGDVSTYTSKFFKWFGDMLAAIGALAKALVDLATTIAQHAPEAFNWLKWIVPLGLVAATVVGVAYLS